MKNQISEQLERTVIDHFLLTNLFFVLILIYSYLFLFILIYSYLFLFILIYSIYS